MRCFAFVCLTRNRFGVNGRYESCWLPLLAKQVENKETTALVPPLDCAWVWHCHRLNPVSIPIPGFGSWSKQLQDMQNVKMMLFSHSGYESLTLRSSVGLCCSDPVCPRLQIAVCKSSGCYFPGTRINGIRYRDDHSAMESALSQ